MPNNQIILPNRWHIIDRARIILAQGIRSTEQQISAERVLSNLYDVRMDRRYEPEDNSRIEDVIDSLEDALETFTSMENHATWYEGNEPEEGWCPES